MFRRICILLGGLAVAATAAGQSPQLDVLRTFDGGDEAMLYRPDAVCFGPDGSTYVLNAGDCQVLQFDGDWELVRSFGREGEGPGEFSDPTGMILRDGRLWVFGMMRVTVFGLDGEYLETLTSRLEMHDPVSTDRGILVRLGSNDRLAALLDDRLELVEKLGPACPDDGDWMERFKACGFVHALPHPDFLALLLNPYDGHLWALDRDGAVVRELELVDTTGRSSMREEDDDSVSMSFTLVMGTGGVDRHGLLWTVPSSYDPTDEDAPQRLVVRGRDLAPVAEYTLPDGVNAYALAHAPDGELLLIDANASLIHVCAYPDGLVAD